MHLETGKEKSIIFIYMMKKESHKKYSEMYRHIKRIDIEKFKSSLKTNYSFLFSSFSRAIPYLKMNTELLATCLQ